MACAERVHANCYNKGLGLLVFTRVPDPQEIGVKVMHEVFFPCSLANTAPDDVATILVELQIRHMTSVSQYLEHKIRW